MIFGFEKKLLEWIEKNFYYFAFAGVIALGILIRYVLREVISADGVAAYLPWFEEIKAGGGIKALSKQVGDYNMFYQFLIALMTYMPFEPIVGYKLLSIAFDIAMAVLMGRFFYQSGNRNEWYTLLGFSLVWINPMVFVNSSEWAQCDIIYSFFCLLAVLTFMEEKYFKSVIWLSLGFVFKLQTVFIMPFFLFAYFIKKKFSVIYFGLIPVFMTLTSLPGIIMGRNIIDVFFVYGNQAADDADYLYINYPSFWSVFVKEHNGPFIKVAIFFTVVLLLMMMYYIYKNKYFVKENMLSIAFLMAYTTVLFLPKMRERYGFMYTMFAIPVALKNKKTIIPAVLLNILALVSYGVVELGSPAPIKLQAIFNVALYIVYVYHIVKQWKSNQAG